MEEEIITLPVPSYIKPLIKGTLEQVETDGRPLIIGGTARLYGNIILGGNFIPDNSRDKDITIIGGTYARLGEGIEKEYAAPNSIEEYLATRDFTINQIAIDNKEAIMTAQCKKDSLEGIVRPTKFELGYRGEISPRAYYRGLRFALQHQAKLAADETPIGNNDFDFVLQGWRCLEKNEELFLDYLEYTRSNIQEYQECLEGLYLSDEEEIKKRIEDII